MKKIIIIIALLTTISISCKKTDDINTRINDSNISVKPTSASIYGILHNEITEHIIIKKIRLIDCDSLESYSTIDNHFSAIDLSIDYGLKSNYINKEESDILKNNLQSFFNKYEDHNLLVEMYESETFYKQVFEDAGFSSKMIETQLLIREVVHSINCTPKETTMIFEYILNNNPYNLSEQELFIITIQYEVTNHSREFWNGCNSDLLEKKEKPRNPNLPSWVKDCDEWTIIMDGVGAGIGSAFGPFGAAALGASFSVGAKRDCECGGRYR